MSSFFYKQEAVRGYVGSAPGGTPQGSVLSYRDAEQKILSLSTDIPGV